MMQHIGLILLPRQGLVRCACAIDFLSLFATETKREKARGECCHSFPSETPDYSRLFSLASSASVGHHRTHLAGAAPRVCWQGKVSLEDYSCPIY